MSIECAPLKILVNTVCCGTIDTFLVYRYAEESCDLEALLAMLYQGHPIGLLAFPEQVANSYVYLASDRANFFTVVLVMMDGAYTAR